MVYLAITQLEIIKRMLRDDNSIRISRSVKDLAYKIVKLGRGARNTANIKNRQPLSKMLTGYI